MAQIPTPLWRSVLRLGGEPDDQLLQNFTALSTEVRPEGIDAHLLAFLDPLVAKTGRVPDVALVEQYYQDLSLKGDPQALAGTIRLGEITSGGHAFLDPTSFRYQLDQFRDEVLTDGLGVLIQHATHILKGGFTYKPLKAPPVQLLGPMAARGYLDQHISELFGQFSSGDIQGNFWEDVGDVLTRSQQKRANPGSSTGVLTGYRELDLAHNGLLRGDLMLVLGFTSQLKTTVVLNMAYHAAVVQGKNVAIVSMETSAEALQATLVCIHASQPKFLHLTGGLLSVTYDRLTRGELTDTEETLVAEVTQDLHTNKAYGQFLYKEPDRDLTVGDVRRWAEQQDDRVPLDLLVVDYIALINPSGGGRSMAESAFANMAYRESKQMAMTFKRGRGIPVLSPVQSNREGFKEAEKNGGRYSLRALAWAPEGEKSADIVLSSYYSAALASVKQAAFCNLKARDRRLVPDPWLVHAEPSIKVVADIDPKVAYTQSQQVNPIAAMTTP